jgi:hypothetical protein
MFAVHFLPPILITRWSLHSTNLLFIQPVGFLFMYRMCLYGCVCVCVCVCVIAKLRFLSLYLTQLDDNYWLTIKSFVFWKHLYSILFKYLLIFIIRVFVIFHILFKLFPYSRSSIFPLNIYFSNLRHYLIRLCIVGVRDYYKPLAEWHWRGENLSNRRKTRPSAFCPPLIPHRRAWNRTHSSR